MGRKGGKAAGKVKRTVCLDGDLARRLASFAGHYGQAQSAVVAEALKVHLAGFRSGGPRDRDGKADVRLVDADAEAA